MSTDNSSGEAQGLVAHSWSVVARFGNIRKVGESSVDGFEERIGDAGASDHLTDSLEYTTHVRSCDVRVDGIDGAVYHPDTIGTLTTDCCFMIVSGNEGFVLDLEYVLYMQYPTLDTTLFL